MLALLGRTGSLDALSVVADGAGGNDERAGIVELLRGNTRVRWHPVDCTADHALGEPWDELPITDEPAVLAAAFLPARIRLARATRDLGLEQLVDGEGGDELFGMSARFGDLVAERDWGAIARYVKARGARGALLHDFAMPRLPPPLRDAWLSRRWRRADPFPPWMSASFRDSEAAREALDQRREWAGFARLSARLPALLEVAPTVGSRSAMQLILSAFGIEGRSPLLDRRVVEFVGTIPAHLLMDPLVPKSFLRRALEGRAPSSVVHRPKSDQLYSWMQSRGLCHEAAHRLCDTIENLPWLHARVRPDALVRFIDSAQTTLPDWSFRAEQACSLLATARWLGRLHQTFGLHLDD
jgi:asparagine synthetase B (glutamine-hydrolysing)